MERHLPRAVMFDDLKAQGISNKVAIMHLLTDQPLAMGMPSPRFVFSSERSRLSREIVNADPVDAVHPEYFGDIAQASLSLFSRIVSKRMSREKLDGAEARSAAQAHYAGPAAQAMRDALDDCGLDATLYRSALTRLHNVSLHDESERGPLYFMLFVATGCLCDVRSAANVVEAYVKSKLAADYLTTQTSLPRDSAPQVQEAQSRFGIIRLSPNGLPIPPIHELSTGPEGTVIGSMPTGAATISVDEPIVSRSHLRIWRNQTGGWCASGLGSTNGSTLLRSEGGDEMVIEAPRKMRIPHTPAPVMPLGSGDVIILGGTVRYMVMSIGG